jgi:hypothetical protein
MRTQFGPDFDWTEIDWATFGRAVGSAIGEILRYPPYGHRSNIGNSDFSLSLGLHAAFRSQESELSSSLGVPTIPGMRLPSTAIEAAIETHTSNSQSSSEASILRAGHSASTPVFLNATFGRVNPSVGAIREYLAATPTDQGAPLVPCARLKAPLTCSEESWMTSTRASQTTLMSLWSLTESLLATRIGHRANSNGSVSILWPGCSIASSTETLTTFVCKTT